LPSARLDTDVLVAGAGPAGATVARLLALRNRQVLLVDPLGPPLQRLEVLAPSAFPVFEALGLVRLLDEPSLACPCLGIRRRWATPEVHFDDFLSHPGSRGAVIDRSRFDPALLREARNAQAHLMQGRVAAVHKENASFMVTIRHGQSRSLVSTRLVVDATGRAATVARQLGASRIFSEHLVAEKLASTNLEPHHPKGVWLEVEGLDASWSYSILGPNGRRENWRIRRRGSCRRDTHLQGVDASSVYLSSAAGDGWVAVGDAVTSFDPITSQGLVNALSTALVASGAILSSNGSASSTFEAYSAAVADTFTLSEVGRDEVYRIFA
jgi:flavin-dependent dehydrogenase